MTKMADEMRWRRWMCEAWRRRVTEKIVMAIVWRLPAYVVYWCYIRVVANATSGSGAVPVHDATFDVCAKAWEQRRGGDRAFAS